MQAEISADGNIDFEMLTTWWQQREAEKWTSTMSFFVLFLCADARTTPARVPRAPHPVHDQCTAVRRVGCTGCTRACQSCVLTPKAVASLSMACLCYALTRA